MEEIVTASTFKNFGSTTSVFSLFEMEALAELDRQASLARFRKRQKQELLRDRFLFLAKLWPVAVGLLIACIAPELRDALAVHHPLGMKLLFPGVVLAGRPEVYLLAKAVMGARIAAMLPQIMLFLEFPLEGLIARMVLQNCVTPAGVTSQLLFLHFLAILHLTMISGDLVGLWIL